MCKSSKSFKLGKIILWIGNGIPTAYIKVNAHIHINQYKYIYKVWWWYHPFDVVSICILYIDLPCAHHAWDVTIIQYIVHSMLIGPIYWI